MYDQQHTIDSTQIHNILPYNYYNIHPKFNVWHTVTYYSQRCAVSHSIAFAATRSGLSGQTVDVIKRDLHTRNHRTPEHKRMHMRSPYISLVFEPPCILVLITHPRLTQPKTTSQYQTITMDIQPSRQQYHWCTPMHRHRIHTISRCRCVDEHDTHTHARSHAPTWNGICRCRRTLPRPSHLLEIIFCTRASGRTRNGKRVTNWTRGNRTETTNAGIIPASSYRICAARSPDSHATRMHTGAVCRTGWN